MEFEFAPQPKWTVQASPGNAGTVDISALALDWAVKFGCRYDPNTGRWLPVFASGHLTLDNGAATGARFETGSPRALLTAAQAAVPLFVTLSLADETLWQGLALVEMGLSLAEDDTVTWQLVSRYWQPLQTPTLWRQTQSGVTHQRPQAMLLSMLGQTLGDAGLPVLSPVSRWPRKLFLQGVVLRGTLGQNLSRLAHTCGVIPFEDRTGLIGMSSLEEISDGRQTANPPASQLPVGRPKVRSVSTQSRWSMEVLAQNASSSGREQLVSFTADSYTRGQEVETLIRYTYPAQTLWVNYEDPVAVDANVAILSHSIEPDNTGAERADIITVRWRYDGNQNPNTTFRVWGSRVNLDAANPYDIREFSYSDALPAVQARTQKTDPWVDWFVRVGSVTDGQTWRTMTQFLNEAKARAVLTYPLWALTAADRIQSNISGRTGQLVPASVSRYRVKPGAVIDGVTETIELRGAADLVPTVTIEAITASGAATPDAPVATGITIPPPNVYPIPFEIPPPPAPTNTPRPPAAPTNLVCTSSADGTSVELTWDAPSGPIDSYAIRRADKPLGLLANVADGTITSYTDTDVMPGQTYEYGVQAVNGAGLGAIATCMVTTSVSPPEPSGDLYITGAGTRIAALFRVDLSDGSSVRIGNAAGGFGGSETSPNSLASDGQTLYMVGQATDRLYTLDTSTGVATAVGQAFSNEQVPLGIGFHNGTLYMVGGRGRDFSRGALYTVNTDTGAETRVGSANRFGANERGPRGLASYNGSLYMVGDGGLYTLNTLTGVASRIGAVTSIRRASGLVVHGGVMYLLTWNPNTISVIDPSTAVASMAVGIAVTGLTGVGNPNASGLASHP